MELVNDGCKQDRAEQSRAEPSAAPLLLWAGPHSRTPFPVRIPPLPPCEARVLGVPHSSPPTDPRMHHFRHRTEQRTNSGASMAAADRLLYRSGSRL